MHKILSLKETAGARLKRKNLFIDFLIGVGTSFIAFPLVQILGKVIHHLKTLFIAGPDVYQRPVQQVMDALSTPDRFFSLVFIVIVIAPVLEELLFRSGMQRLFRRRFNLFFSIGLTSIAFAGAHYRSDQGWSNIEILGALFFLSCLLGYLYEKRESVWAPIGLHASFNLLTVLAILVEPQITTKSLVGKIFSFW